MPQHNDMKRRKHRAVSLLIAAAAMGIATAGGATQSNTATSNPTGCHAIGNVLPDPACTPGATDPRVTQENIGSTICVSGYTSTVRPPVSVTNPIKQERMQAYGFTDSTANYELDHLISLELGGAPSDVKNL